MSIDFLGKILGVCLGPERKASQHPSVPFGNPSGRAIKIAKVKIIENVTIAARIDKIIIVKTVSSKFQ